MPWAAQYLRLWCWSYFWCKFYNETQASEAYQMLKSSYYWSKIQGYFESRFQAASGSWSVKNRVLGANWTVAPQKESIIHLTDRPNIHMFLMSGLWAVILLWSELLLIQGSWTSKHIQMIFRHIILCKYLWSPTAPTWTATCLGQTTWHIHLWREYRTYQQTTGKLINL